MKNANHPSGGSVPATPAGPFTDKAPRRTLWVVIALSLVLTGSVIGGATRHREQAPVVLEPCALVATPDGQYCR